MTLPPCNKPPVPDRQARRLAAWMAEWDIHCRLSADSDASPHPPSEAILQDGDVAPTDPSPQPGEVRLLSPTVPGAGARLIHVALFAGEDAPSLLSVPYSRFSEPAVPGEFLTGRAEPLQVLCPWNARPLPLKVLERSWVVDNLSEEEEAQALAVLRHVRSGAALPSELADLVGPPLSHPDDPRHAYINRETLLMDRLAGTAPLTYPLPESTDLPKAAEPGEAYGEEPTSE